VIKLDENLWCNPASGCYCIACLPISRRTYPDTVLNCIIFSRYYSSLYHVINHIFLGLVLSLFFSQLCYFWDWAHEYRDFVYIFAENIVL